MIKGAVAAVVFSFIFTTSVFAAGDGKSQEPAPSFEEKKAEVLKRLDEQMHNLQEAKTCVKAAKNHDDMKACRQKQMAERKKIQEEMRSKK